MPIQESDLILWAGGNCLKKFGTLVWRRTPPLYGGEDLKETHTRDGTGLYLDRDGVLRSAESNVPRVDWVDLDGDGIRETPSWVIEASRQNELLRSKQLDDAIWTTTRATITANPAQGPDDTVSGDALVEDNTASDSHYISQTAGGTADVVYAHSVYAKPETRTWLWLRVRNNATGTPSVTQWFDLTNGVTGSGAVTGTGVVRLAHISDATTLGWYRCTLGAFLGSGSTNNDYQYGLATADAATDYTGDGSSRLFLFNGQFEDNATDATSMIETTSAAVARAVDVPAIPLPITPGTDLTVYVRVARPLHADASGTLSGSVSPGIFSLSLTTNPRIRMHFKTDSRNVVAQIFDASASSVVAEQAIPSGTAVEGCAQFVALDTAGKVRLDVGSGFGSFSSTVAGFSAFGDTTLNLGIIDNANNKLNGGLIDLLFVQGQHTLADCQAVVA